MIFVTVGDQMPFDRLVRTVDEWARTRGRDDVFAQIGETPLRPARIEWVRSLAPAEFRRKTEEADVIVAHAGMGTVISGLELGKRLIVMPRKGALRETRNDHQVASAEWLAKAGHVDVASDEEELLSRLDTVDERRGRPRIGKYASRELLDALSRFVHES